MCDQAVPCAVCYPDSSCTKTGPALILEKVKAAHPETCVTHDGDQRCWRSFTSTAPAASSPLIVDLHGYTSSSIDLLQYSGWSAIAEREGMTVVWPQSKSYLDPTYGVNSTMWGASAYFDEAVDDVSFIRQAIEDTIAAVADVHTIDRSRIYVSGHSMGCMMAQRLMLQANDLVTAVGCMAGYLDYSAPAPGILPNNIPIIEIHGTEDDVVNYSSTAGEGFGNHTSGAVANIEGWKELYGCSEEEAWYTDLEYGYQGNMNYTTLSYLNCEQGAKVALVSAIGGDHLPYYLGEDIFPLQTTEMAWEFVSRFSRDPAPGSPLLDALQADLAQAFADAAEAAANAASSGASGVGSSSLQVCIVLLLMVSQMVVELF